MTHPVVVILAAIAAMALLNGLHAVLTGRLVDALGAGFLLALYLVLTRAARRRWQ